MLAFESKDFEKQWNGLRNQYELESKRGILL
jgi:hypothetical protein